MIARIALALVAVLAIAWTAVLLRDDLVGRDAAVRSFFVPRQPAAERNADLRRLRDADFLDPSSYWRLAEASNRLLAGDSVAAARTARALVRDEPDNISGWRVLAAATRGSDPASSRRAVARVEALNPFEAR